jgi:hypothetical protein
MFQTRTYLVVAFATIALMVGVANAGIIPIVSMTGSNGGDRYANGYASLANGSGIDKSVDPDDPSTWTMSGSSYGDELMSWYFGGPDNSSNGTYLPNFGTNNKRAWISFDLGTSQPLAMMYLFNNNYQGGPSGTDTFNVYTADTPTVALPATPNKQTFSNTGLTPEGDYDFASGGWSMFNTAGVLTAPKAGVGTVDLTGTSARYVAIEILTNHGDTYNGGRVGLDEVAIMAGEIPEPASLALFGLGGLMILRRKR